MDNWTEEQLEAFRKVDRLSADELQSPDQVHTQFAPAHVRSAAEPVRTMTASEPDSQRTKEWHRFVRDCMMLELRPLAQEVGKSTGNLQRRVGELEEHLVKIRKETAELRKQLDLQREITKGEVIGLPKLPLRRVS